MTKKCLHDALNVRLNETLLVMIQVSLKIWNRRLNEGLYETFLHHVAEQSI